MPGPVDEQDEPMTPLERVKTFWSTLDQGHDSDDPWWDNILYDYITPISAFRHDADPSSSSSASSDEQHVAAEPAPNTCTVLYLLTVPQALCNRMGNLHGGAAATIFDLCTSVAMAPVSRFGFWLTSGVSRSLNITYLKGVRQGSRVVLVCDVVGLGARMGFMNGRIRAIKPHLLKTVEGCGRNLTGLKEGLTEEQLCTGPVLCVGEHGKVNTDEKPRPARYPVSSSTIKKAAARSNL